MMRQTFAGDQRRACKVADSTRNDASVRAGDASWHFVRQRAARTVLELMFEADRFNRMLLDDVVDIPFFISGNVAGRARRTFACGCGSWCGSFRVKQFRYALKEVLGSDWTPELFRDIGGCGNHVFDEIRRPIDFVQFVVYHPMRSFTRSVAPSIEVHSDSGVDSEAASIASSSSALFGKIRA